MRTAFVLLLVIGLSAAGIVCYVTYATSELPPNFRTTTVQRGNLLATISATGTVEPEEVVDVGAQVAGRIVSLGEDAKRSTPDAPKTIDYGSVVERGTVLAVIDDAVYRAQKEQAQAALSRAQADLLQAQANLSLADAKLSQTDAEWKRAQRLARTWSIQASTRFRRPTSRHKKRTSRSAGLSQIRTSYWPRPIIWRPRPVSAQRPPTSP